MVNQKGYFDLLDWLEDQPIVRPQQFFEKMKAAFGIANLLYIDVAITPVGPKLHTIHHTLEPKTAQALAAMGSKQLLPVLQAALTAVKPLDWATLLRLTPKCHTVYAQALRLGLPPEGVCYPLVSREGRSALLVINVAASRREWPKFRRMFDRDIQSLAAQFHAAILERESAPESRVYEAPKLTRRERETLCWAAAGKSYWEIATILGISERTVRYFMSNARRKLNVVTNTQAVAEAVWHGLIPHP